ncbi:MAG: TetR family transcriptional regulator [Myxococcaceae bacterium]
MAGLDRQKIVEVALDLVDARGFEALTVRSLATRLRVENPALYWHFRDKQALVNAMAAHLLAPLGRPLRPGGWRDALARWARLLRHAITARRDGAAIVAAADLTGSVFHEGQRALHAALVGDGLDASLARVAVITVCDFTLGAVLEERSEPGSARRRGARAMFEAGVQLLVDGIDARQRRARDGRRGRTASKLKPHHGQ